MGIHPDRDQEWFEKETKNMSRTQIAQELECNFNMSGETVFHPEDMEKLKGLVCEPKYRTGFDRNFWIWEEYREEFEEFTDARDILIDEKKRHLYMKEMLAVLGTFGEHVLKSSHGAWIQKNRPDKAETQNYAKNDPKK